MVNTNTYKDAGVNIDTANLFVEHLAKTANINTGFAATFDLGSNSLLVASTDGVGTKALLALEYADFFENTSLEWLGIDLVAAVFNDVITTGASPLFLLDYYGTPKLELEQANALINGIQRGLKNINATLIGGETAEMTNTYQPGAFDFVGFGVGVVDKQKLIDGRNIKEGDVVLGIESSGAHTNGFTLIRKLLAIHEFKNLRHKIIHKLLQPSYVYAPLIESLISVVDVKAMAHISGGGLLENIPRTIPVNYRVVLDVKSWEWPETFRLIQSIGNVPIEEMYRVFNVGIGFTVVVSEDQAEQAIKWIKDCGYNAYIIGCVIPAHKDDHRCLIA